MMDALDHFHSRRARHPGRSRAAAAVSGRERLRAADERGEVAVEEEASLSAARTCGAALPLRLNRHVPRLPERCVCVYCVCVLCVCVLPCGMKARLSRRHTAARVFGVELVSLLQSGEDQAPQVVRMCTAFVERHGLVDGIYRLSGVASNTKRLREEFDAGRVPDLTRSVYMRDVHCVSSLCKQFFRDLPEPLLTYHLFHLFDEAVRAPSVEERLQKIHHAIHQLPLPHYNTLEFLISHLSHMASHSAQTNMHAQNLAIVWAPNLLRSRGTEGGPVGGAAFLEVRVQSVVVETLLSHRQRLFCNVFQPSASRPHNGLSTQNSSAAEETALPPPLEGEVASRSALRLVSLEEAQRAASRSHGALPEDLRTPPTLRRKLHHHHQQHHQHHQETQEQEQQHQDHRLQQDQAENDHHHLHRLNIHPRADSVGSRMVCVGDDYQLDKETKRKKGGLLSFFNRYTQSSRRRRKNSNASDSVQLRGYHGEREAKQQHRLSQSTANLLEAHATVSQFSFTKEQMDLTGHACAVRRGESIPHWRFLSFNRSTVTESLKEVDAELEEVKEPNFTRQNVKDGPKDESTNLHSSLRDAGPGQTSEKSSETQAAPSEPPLEAATDAPCCEDVSMKTLITSTQPTEQDLNLGDSEPLVLEVPKVEPCVDNSVVNGEQRPATGTSLLASAATETAVVNVEIVGEAAKKGATNSNDSRPRVYADGKKTEFDQPNGCNIISRNPSACDDDDDHCELVSAQIGTGDHVMRASTSADSPERGSSEVTCVATVQNLGSDSASTDTTASAISALSSQEPLVSASSDTADEEGDAATQGSREGGSTAPLGSPAATLGCMSASGTEASDEEPTNDSGDESHDVETDGGVPESLTAQNDVDLAQAPKTTTDMHLSTSSEATVDTSVAGESVQNVFMSTETMTISKVFPRQRNAHHLKPADEQCADQLPTAADEVEANLANTDTSRIEEARISNFGYPAVDLELSETDKALLTTNILLDIPIDVKIAEDMASPGQRPLPRYGIKVSPRSPSKTIQQGFFYHKYSQALDLSSNRTESSVDADPPCVLNQLALQDEGARGMEQRRKCSAMDSDSKNKCAGEPRTPGLKGNGQFSPESGGPREKASCESAEPLGMDGVALQPADTELVRTWVEIRLSKAFPVVRSKPQFTSQLGSG
ncbi:unnamed protein product [Lampetra fluviatilis]